MKRKTVSREKLDRLARKNKSNKAIARHFKVSESTIKRRIRNYGLKGTRPRGRKPTRQLTQIKKSLANEGIPEISEIVFPKKWKDLDPKEQKEWIESHYMPKTKIPEPILKRNDKIVKGILKLESGSKLKFGMKPATVSRGNPNLIREYEGWIGKWLATVFHDRSFPHVKYFGIANPSRSKWIAQELSSEILSEFYAILLQIRWKYGFFKGKKRKKQRKPSISTLSLKDNIKEENSP